MLTAKDKTKFIIFLFVATFFITSQIKAADEFKTEYVITYKAGDNNETEVFQDISLTNLKDDVIATNYTLSIKQLQIYDILAKDGFGEMEINTQKDGFWKIQGHFFVHLFRNVRSSPHVELTAHVLLLNC